MQSHGNSLTLHDSPVEGTNTKLSNLKLGHLTPGLHLDYIFVQRNLLIFDLLQKN